jgi:hypothetical protein
MSKLPKLSFFVISLILFSCIKYNSLNIKSLIIETQLSGDRVVFADLSKDLLNQEIINKNWSRINSEKSMPYFRLKNNSGKIKGDFIYNAERYLIVQTNKGNLFKWKYKPMVSRSLPSHLATLSAIEEAKLFIGKNIWLNEIHSDSIFINNSEKRFKKFDKVMVLGIRVFQNSKTDMPIWLEIDTNIEHNAFIRYNGKFKTELRQNNYYKENPLKKEWSKTIIENLKKKKIEYGMSFEQVRVSIGNPEIINNTSSVNGVSQQWVYGKNLDEKKYLLFKNGKLVSM